MKRTPLFAHRLPGADGRQIMVSVPPSDRSAADALEACQLARADLKATITAARAHGVVFKPDRLSKALAQVQKAIRALGGTP